MKLKNNLHLSMTLILDDLNIFIKSLVTVKSSGYCIQVKHNKSYFLDLKVIYNT